jgi:hypothetical protein
MEDTTTEVRYEYVKKQQNPTTHRRQTTKKILRRFHYGTAKMGSLS